MGPVVQRQRRYILANLTTMYWLLFWPCIRALIIRAYKMVLNGIKSLVLTAKNFRPEIFTR